MENTRIVEQQRKTNLKAEEIQLFKESFVIVPYYVSGFYNYSNLGISEKNIDPNDFETFKRIWTGNQSCTINWKDSMICQQDYDTKELIIDYRCGEVFLGAIQANDSQSRINNDVSFSEYKSQDIKKTINFYVNKHFKITDYYLLMFYKIPEYSGNTLYRLANIERDFIGRELVGYVLTFETINYDLANTGHARAQNIMPNNPGQGYLECIVKDKSWWDKLPQEEKDRLEIGKDFYQFYDRFIVADKRKMQNDPITQIEVKLIGVGILKTVVCVGRPVWRGDNFRKYRAPRLLFPYNFKPPETPNLFHSQQNVSNFYFGNFKPTLQYYKELMTFIKDSFTPVNEWKYEGFLEYDYAKLQQSNPVENGKFKNHIYGYIDTNNGGGNRNAWWINYHNSDDIVIDTSGNYGQTNEYVIRAGYNTEIWNWMMLTWWTQKQYKTLTIDIKNDITFGTTIGSALSSLFQGKYFVGLILATVGILGIVHNKIKNKTMQLNTGIIASSIIDYNNQLFKGNKIPFNMIDNSDNGKGNPNTIFFDGSTLVTAFEADLTDMFHSLKNPKRDVYNPDAETGDFTTLNIGQTKDENGNWLNKEHEPLLIATSHNMYLLAKQNINEGYIIDRIIIGAIFKGEISIEFKNRFGEVVWSGIYQSEGKWTNSMRDIWTEIETSPFGKENSFFYGPVSYPQPIPEPDYSFPDEVEQTWSSESFINGGEAWFKNHSVQDRKYHFYAPDVIDKYQWNVIGSKYNGIKLKDMSKLEFSHSDNVNGSYSSGSCEFGTIYLSQNILKPEFCELYDRVEIALNISGNDTQIITIWMKDFESNDIWNEYDYTCVSEEETPSGYTGFLSGMYFHGKVAYLIKFRVSINPTSDNKIALRMWFDYDSPICTGYEKIYGVVGDPDWFICDNPKTWTNAIKLEKVSLFPR